MGMTAKIKASIVATLSAANDMGVASQPFAELFELDLTDGTAANQANNAFTDERVIVASGTDELDLAGILLNVFGSIINAGAVKAMLITANAANINNVVVGGAAANACVGPFADATDKLVLGPGDGFLITRRSAAGMLVTAGTGDKLLIANSGAGSSVTYRITLLLEA